MSDKRFVDIRIETVKDEEGYIERLKHNTRFKKDKRVVNERGFINERGEIVKGFNNKYAKSLLSVGREEYQDIRREHKKKYKDFREKRATSIAEGILYFSKGINEDFDKNPKEFFKRLKIMLEDFTKEKNTEILSFQVHIDEAGNYHTHFFFKNFDAKSGKSLNFTRNKENGSWLQDLAHKHFSSFGKGYERGLKKTKTERYLSVEEYKALQESKKLLSEAQKELLSSKEEHKHTKALNEELKSDNELLKAENEKITEQLEDLQKERDTTRKELLAIGSEFQELLDDFEEFILEENDKNKLEKLKALFTRYSKNENAERMIKSIQKGRKHLKQVKSKYTRAKQRA